LLLEELLASGKLEPGQKVLCLVPESGRFLFAYMLLQVVEGVSHRKPSAIPMPRTDPPKLAPSSDPLTQSLVRGLAAVWFDFEDRLCNVPIVSRLYDGRFDLIGAMFIVEGLGQRIARRWGDRAKELLALENDAVSFFLYHSESDVQHFRRLDWPARKE
jgi:3-oxoacyl-[acyl-carrier-protein] synthase-3